MRPTNSKRKLNPILSNEKTLELLLNVILKEGGFVDCQNDIVVWPAAVRI